MEAGSLTSPGALTLQEIRRQRRILGMRGSSVVCGILGNIVDIAIACESRTTAE